MRILEDGATRPQFQYFTPVGAHASAANSGRGMGRGKEGKQRRNQGGVPEGPDPWPFSERQREPFFLACSFQIVPECIQRHQFLRKFPGCSPPPAPKSHPHPHTTLPPTLSPLPINGPMWPVGLSPVSHSVGIYIPKTFHWSTLSSGLKTGKKKVLFATILWEPHCF